MDRDQKLAASRFPSRGGQIPEKAPTLHDSMEMAVKGQSATAIQPAPSPSVDETEKPNAHWIGNIGISPIGLFIHEAVDEKEWREFIPNFEILASIKDWAKADWCRYGHDGLGISYAEIASIAGLKSEKSAETYASIARKSSELNRFNSPSFAHSLKVMGLPEDEKIFWLQKARNEGWSSAELGAALKPRKLGSGRAKISYHREIKESKKTVRAVVTKIAKMPDAERREFAEYLRDLLTRLDAQG